MKKMFDILKNYWLLLIILLQPILDIVAFFTFDSNITIISFAARTLMLIFIVVYTLYESTNKKKYFINLLPIGIFVLLHLLNSYRVGFISAFSDLRYIIMVFQMPVITICLIDYLKKYPQKVVQIKLGLVVNLITIFISVILSVITKSYLTTYSDYGLTGWFASANTQSMILVAISPLFMYYFNKSKGMINFILSYIIIIFLLFFNGTKACFAALLVVLVFMIFNSLNEKKEIKIKIGKVLISIGILILVILNYGSSTTFKRNQNVSGTTEENEKIVLDELEKEIGEKINFSALSKEDVIKVLKTSYYYKELIDIFGEDKVYEQLKEQLSYSMLSNNRLRKKTYARIISHDSDVLTKIVGFEYTQIGQYGMDLENDLTALFYYYGYLGFLIYILFILYFVFILAKTFWKKKKFIFHPEFVAICITFALILFGSEYTGAFLRKTNANIYLSLLMIIIYFNYQFKKDSSLKIIKVITSKVDTLNEPVLELINRLSENYQINVIVFDENEKSLQLNDNIFLKYVKLNNILKHLRKFIIKILMIKEIISDNDFVISMDREVSQLLNKFGCDEKKKIVLENNELTEIEEKIYNNINLVILMKEKSEQNYNLNVICYNDLKVQKKQKFYNIWENIV